MKNAENQKEFLGGTTQYKPSNLAHQLRKDQKEKQLNSKRIMYDDANDQV